MKESMLLCPRVETGFGNLPNDFTSYDSKWSNFAINYGLRFEKKPMKLRKLLIHSSVIQIMPGLGLVPMMLQMNLNKLLFLMIDSNPKIKETKQVFTSEITETNYLPVTVLA